MKALVVGYGSIGSLHARVLEGLGHKVTVVSKRAVEHTCVKSSIADALQQPHDYAVIASNTAHHASDLDALQASGFRGTALVEKPLFSHWRDSSYPFRVYVGYNLRFHPLVRSLKNKIADKKVLSVHAYVGQHLSTWRPGRDHRQNYSAHKSDGGGVLRDLSHELDLVQYLFGATETVKAIGGRYGDVTVDSDDVYGLVLRTSNCPVLTLQLNYLDHTTRREMVVVTGDTSYKLDFIAGQLVEGQNFESHPAERALTYTELHRAILEGDGQDVCTYDEGLALVQLIENAERDALKI